jgi:NAD(P) transhydrogenase subunit alpha
METSKLIESAAKAVENSPDMISLLFILALAVFLGFELIAKVPSTLHTPLMSGANAISGITIVGAIMVLNNAGTNQTAQILGAAALGFAAVNVVGGYLVTDRMLGMFSKKAKKPEDKA